MSAKRILATLLAVFLLFSLAGCEDLLAALSGNGASNEPFTPTVITELTPTEFLSCYRDQLSPNEAAIYDAAISLAMGENSFSPALPEVPDVCKNRQPTEAEQNALTARVTFWIGNALYAARLDHPEVFWVNFNAFSLEYKLQSDKNGIVKLADLQVTVEKNPEITDASASFAALTTATADFAPTGDSTAEKVRYINDYLCERISYDLDAPLRGSLIGALVGGKCVCEGYGQAFLYLCRRAGIEAVSIPGYATSNGDTEGHLWNAVRIDGVFYAVDVTWNDSTESDEYLLVGTSTACHEGTFGETHDPDTLSEDGAQKAFVFPTISQSAHQ